MKIIPQDGLLRYLVKSEKSGQEYLVDLVPYWGTGFCSCPHFQFRLEPQLTIRPLDQTQYRCHHIRACRDYLADDLINTLVRQQINMETPVRANSGLSPRFARSGVIQFRLEQNNK